MAEQVYNEILGFVLQEIYFLQNGSTNFLADLLLQIWGKKFQFIHFENLQFIFLTIFFKAQIHKFQSLLIRQPIQSLNLQIKFLFLLVFVSLRNEIYIENACKIGHHISKKYNISKNDNNYVKSAFCRFGGNIAVTYCENYSYGEIHAGDVFLFDGFSSQVVDFSRVVMGNCEVPDTGEEMKNQEDYYYSEQEMF